MQAGAAHPCWHPPAGENSSNGRAHRSGCSYTPWATTPGATSIACSRRSQRSVTLISSFPVCWAGQAISSLHLPPQPYSAASGLALTNDAQLNADTLGALGVGHVVVPLFPLPTKMAHQAGDTLPTMLMRAVEAAGPDFWKRVAALLNERGAALRPLGIGLGYHNHNVEFAPIGSTTGWDIIAGETDRSLVHFEIDVGWVASAGLDPVAFLKRHAGRVHWMHVKDVGSAIVPNFVLDTISTEVGSGLLDWTRILPAANKAGVRHFYVEQERPFASTRLATIEKSFAYLSGV